MITFTIPLIPPSGNHYKNPNASRGFIQWYLTKEAKAFHEAVAILCRKQIRGDAYEVEVYFYLPKGFRGDVANLEKVVLDSLHQAGVIDTDSKVQDITLRKRKDWANPRTEVTIQAVPRLY